MSVRENVVAGLVLRGGRQDRPFLGSVIGRLLHFAPCPVLTVPVKN